MYRSKKQPLVMLQQQMFTFTITYCVVSFSYTSKQLYCNDMKYGTDFYVVTLCQVYKSSVRFNTNTTSFKK